MALIKCPECGKEMSSLAKVCINCGCPIAELNPAGTVSINMNTAALVKMYIIDLETGNELWSGNNGQIARFDVQKETEISIVGSLERRRPHKGTKAIVRGGKKYEHKQVAKGLGVAYTINEIDVIDSGR